MGIESLIHMHLRPLSRISPSRYVSLRECVLKELWAADRQQPLLPVAPSARLGSISHKLLEKAFSGELADEGEMERSWDEELNKHEREMERIPIEKHLLPLSSHAYNYRVKQIMTFNAVRPFLGRGPFCLRGAKTFEAEQPVQTRDGKIAGRIDLIRHTGESISIIDFKSGIITDGEEGGRIKEEYVVQMKLYAAIHFLARERWPDRLALVGLEGSEYEIPFDKEECLHLVDEATTFLQEINEHINQGTAIDSFAGPSPKACKFCAFRPACQKYWATRNAQDAWPIDALGILAECKQLGNGTLRVELDGGDKIIIIRGLSQERHGLSYDIGCRLLFCDLGMDAKPGFFKETPMTTGYVIGN